MSEAAYPPGVLEELARLAEADPGREVCGVIARCGSRVEVLPLTNAAPAERAARSFAIDTRELLRAVRAVEASGGAVAAIYHSHVDAPADLSAEDRRQAFAGGAPLWPGVEQLVLGLRGGRVREVRRYRLEGGRFSAAPLD